MGQTALLDAFAQSDLDMRGFHIKNCPDIGAAEGVDPQSYPKVPNQWIDQYNAATGLFGGSQPTTINLADWPSTAGNAGKVLAVAAGSTDDPLAGGRYVWVNVIGAGTGPTGLSAINVKATGLASGNAVGDGVQDDTVAIQGALNAAGNPGTAYSGLAVYFPAGNYKVTARLTVPSGRITLVGDSPWASVLSCPVGALPASVILDLSGAGGALVQRLGFNGNVFGAVSGNIPVRHGVYANKANSIVIDQCVFYGFLGFGIGFTYCYEVVAQDNWIFGCGQYGIGGFFSPRSLIRGNQIQSCQGQGIVMINSQNSTVANNQVYECGVATQGITLQDSDNSGVTGNVVQQCLVGVLLATSYTRAWGSTFDSLYSYGYTFTGNTICRNYFGGVQIMYAHGFKLTGNVITDNGQGGSHSDVWTVEPGMMVLPGTANQGAGYQLGDIVTLDPSNGIGTPAKAVVVKATPITSGAGGALSSDSLMVISYGAYTTWPTNPVKVSLGTGVVSVPQQANCIFTGTMISSPGSGYSVGQALRHNLGYTDSRMINPVRVMVTAVNSSGGVTGFQYMDGGGYNTVGFSALGFIGDAYVPQTGLVPGVPGFFPQDPSITTAPGGPGTGLDYADLPDAGTGFTLSALFGRRYSMPFEVGVANATYNFQTYHAVWGGVVSGNVIDRCRYGSGWLNAGAGAYNPTGANDRAYYVIFNGNNILYNKFPFKGAVIGTNGATTLDNNYNMPLQVGPGTPATWVPTSIVDSQVHDFATPIPNLIGTAPLNIIL